MATTSEIKITEAYIGLLGRAPDPDGLKYWADALDAMGGTDVALKKLTKDITLSAEWASGLGANDASTRAGADAVVKGQFNNLFGYDPSRADYEYYTPKLVAGEFTASSLVVVLIQGADTTDAATLDFKQQAATYYVQTVPQAKFTKSSAHDAVKDVSDAESLTASKTATDLVAAGSSVLTSSDRPSHWASSERSYVGTTANDLDAADTLADSNPATETVGVSDVKAMSGAAGADDESNPSARNLAASIPSLPLATLLLLAGRLSLVGLRRLQP